MRGIDNELNPFCALSFGTYIHPDKKSTALVQPQSDEE